MDGVTVKPTPVPFSVRLDRSTSGDFDAVLGGWAADYADPSSFTDLFVTGNSYNRGRWSNAEYDEAVKAASSTDAGDEQARWDDFKKQSRSSLMIWVSFRCTKSRRSPSE